MREEEPPTKRELRDGRALAVIPVSLGLATGALLLFAWLSEQVLRRGTETFDQVIRQAIHAHSTPALTACLRVVTDLGDWMVLVPALVVLGVLFARQGMRQHLWLLTITMAGALLLDGVLKLAVHRPRPTPYFIPKPPTYSFPSGHSLVSLCFYGLLAGMLSLRLRKSWQRAAVWSGAGLLIGAIGFSRIYLGVHWPSDVLAGYAAAVVWMGAVRVLVSLKGLDHPPS
jgi:undecaprenyl-diphosphatase